MEDDTEAKAYMEGNEKPAEVKEEEKPEIVEKVKPEVENKENIMV